MAEEAHIVRGLPQEFVPDENERLEDVSLDVAKVTSAQLNIERFFNREKEVTRTVPREFIIEHDDGVIKVIGVGRSQMTSITGMLLRELGRIENDDARKQRVLAGLKAFGGTLVFKCYPLEEGQNPNNRTARATVTPQYAPTPASVIAGVVEGVCQEKGMAVISKASYNTNVYYGMQFMFEDNVDYSPPPGAHQIQNAPEGGYLRCGIEVRTSLIATHSLTAGAFFVNSVCTNGLVVSHMEGELDRKHIGNTEELMEALKVTVGKIIDKRFAIVDKIKEVRTIELDDLTKIKVVLMALERANVSQKAMMAALAVSEAGEHASSEQTMWGAVNVITGIATHGGFLNTAKVSIDRAAEDLLENHAGYIEAAQEPKAMELVELVRDKRRLAIAAREERLAKAEAKE